MRRRGVAVKLMNGVECVRRGVNWMGLRLDGGWDVGSEVAFLVCQARGFRVWMGNRRWLGTCTIRIADDGS